MRLVHEEILINNIPQTSERETEGARDDIRLAIASVHWPLGSGSFTIRAESGKKRGMGNGVSPIRKAFINELCSPTGWQAEERLDLAAIHRPGDVDAVLTMPSGKFCVEWETGNISSCHRSLNKMALGLLKGKILAASVIVPSRELYPFLTDRIANYLELTPYLELWRSLDVQKGFLSIVVVEHDAVSETVERIPKGTDGRSSV
jgi:hypothetical protein